MLIGLPVASLTFAVCELKLRARRDPKRVENALREVETTARSERNLLPAILDAVKAYATVGEISGVLAGVFGHYQESVVI